MDAHEKFSQFFTTQLNPDQQQAVEPKNGVLLVCAGAGSGKTRVITARMTNLILNHSVPAQSIIALTFTNKAAREMKERIAHFLPNQQLPFVGTFHSYCLRILKTYRQYYTNHQFSILDDDDQDKMLRAIINRYGLQKKVSVKTLSSAISQQKNSLLGISDPLLEELYSVYEKEKKYAHALDFDDLLLEVLNLFKTSEPFKQEFQHKIRHVLVDEYQDTNLVQHDLLQQITCSGPKKFTLDSLCVVGDEDQSIYSWRGATIKNIVYFKRDFPEAQSITIAQNYRSVQSILDTANAIIDNNLERNPKKLWSAKTGTDRIRRMLCASSYQEGDVVARLAQAHFQKRPLESIAVLYRSLYQSRALEEALIRNSVPYKIIGGIRFYDRQEIKDLLAYLRIVANPFDRVAVMRVINTPSRGLGDKFTEQLMQLWDEQPFLNIHEILAHMLEQKLVTGNKRTAVQQFESTFTGHTAQSSAQQVLEDIVYKLDYHAYLKDQFSPEDAQAKIENVKELNNALHAFEKQDIVSVERFLEEVALLQEHITGEESAQYISLMTLHAAKGLEFDTVTITGLEEQLLPSNHALYAENGVEEERRLLYVGITRARERLLLTHVRYRYAFGTMTDQRASRFVHELPEAVIDADCAQWPSNEITRYIREWYSTITMRPASYEVQAPAAPAPILRSEPINWRTRQRVKHPTFGIGTIEAIDTQKDHLTIKFRTATKKISSKFVSLLE